MSQQANKTPWYDRATEALLPIGLDKPTMGSCIIILAMFVFSVAMFFYNKYGAKYPNSIDLNLLRQFIGIWVIYRFCTLIPFKYPRQIMVGICFTVFCIVASVMAAGAIAITPSLHLLNWSLLAMDLKLGFHQLALMKWTHQFPRLVKILHFAYNSWAPQFLIVPLTLAIFSTTKEIAKWTFATLVAMVVGGIIYLVMPSSSPASVMYSPYFPQSCYVCIAHFFYLHHHIILNSNGCGLIDFPSFHVIDAVLNAWALRKVKVIGWLMIILNIILIASTLMLGYHFLIDVIAGCVLAIFAHYAAELLD